MMTYSIKSWNTFACYINSIWEIDVACPNLSREQRKHHTVGPVSNGLGQEKRVYWTQKGSTGFFLCNYKGQSPVLVSHLVLIDRSPPAPISVVPGIRNHVWFHFLKRGRARRGVLMHLTDGNPALRVTENWGKLGFTVSSRSSGDAGITVSQKQKQKFKKKKAKNKESQRCATSLHLSWQDPTPPHVVPRGGGGVEQFWKR